MPVRSTARQKPVEMRRPDHRGEEMKSSQSRAHSRIFLTVNAQLRNWYRALSVVFEHVRLIGLFSAFL